MNPELPVLIVGAGPVGLSLALALSRNGIDVEVFEAEDDLSSEMRASTVHASTLEMFEEWGVVDKLLEAGKVSDRLQFWERGIRKKIAEFSFSLIAGDTKYPFRLQCPQNVVTRVLRAELETVGSCKLHFGQAAHQYVDHGDSVTLRVNSKGALREVQGSFLVGCDGAHSVVRKQLGFKLSGKTYEDRFLLIGTDIDFSRYFEGMGPVAYIYDPKEWAILLQLPTIIRTVFRVKPEEDADAIMQDDAIRERMWALMGTQDDFEIQLKSIYKVHQRVAEKFREGRVILAGDAAHLNNPAGGMGLNSGVHDAYLLAHTLIRIFAGESEELLDTYSEQRRKVADELIQQASDKNYKDMVIEDWEGRAERNRAMNSLSKDSGAARDFLLNAALLPQRPQCQAN